MPSRPGTFTAGRVAWLHASFGVGASLGPLLMTGVLALAPFVARRLRGARPRDRAAGHRLPQDPRPVAGRIGGLERLPAHAALGHSARLPVVLGSGLLFLVYTGVEAIPGAWAYSLLTEGRGMPEALAGTSVALYWGGLTLGRMASGAIAHRVAPLLLLRGSLLLAPVWIAVLWAGFGFALDLARHRGPRLHGGSGVPPPDLRHPGARRRRAFGQRRGDTDLPRLRGLGGLARGRRGPGASARAGGRSRPSSSLCALAVVVLHEALRAFLAAPPRRSREAEPPGA